MILLVIQYSVYQAHHIRNNFKSVEYLLAERDKKPVQTCTYMTINNRNDILS